MIAHVFERARRAKHLDDVVVATDSDEVLAACRGLGIPCEMTSAEHRSGTDRVWEVAQRRPADVYVNVQGDEPLITPGHIERLVRPFHERADAQVTTLAIRATAEEIPNPNAVKVVFDRAGRALYFSRHPVPYDRNGTAPVRFKHIGMYGFRREALETFHRLAPTPLSTAEDLEQLRLLENGIGIIVTETDEPTIGVDTEEDLRAVTARLTA
jgi:3-deoxy-manno-octulosonate cytidylyltransferase (CMP-KDO synthetase)